MTEQTVTTRIIKLSGFGKETTLGIVRLDQSSKISNLRAILDSELGSTNNVWAGMKFVHPEVMRERVPLTPPQEAIYPVEWIVSTKDIGARIYVTAPETTSPRREDNNKKRKRAPKEKEEVKDDAGSETDSWSDEDAKMSTGQKEEEEEEEEEEGEEDEEEDDEDGDNAKLAMTKAQQSLAAEFDPSKATSKNSIKLCPRGCGKYYKQFHKKCAQRPWKQQKLTAAAEQPSAAAATPPPTAAAAIV